MWYLCARGDGIEVDHLRGAAAKEDYEAVLQLLLGLKVLVVGHVPASACRTRNLVKRL